MNTDTTKNNRRYTVTVKKIGILLLPYIALGITFLVHLLLPDRQVTKSHDAFTVTLTILLVLITTANILSIRITGVRKKTIHLSPLIATGILFTLLWDLLTLKLNLLHPVFFPNPDNVFYVFVTSWQLLIKNLLYSMRLFFTGLAFGTVIGFVAGVAMGWNRRVSYWLAPIQKLVGSIPAAALLAITLAVAPTTFSAEAALIALAVIFPVSVMTGTGVLNVKKNYFEVARTLGGNRNYLIFNIAIPSALPSVFIGLFMALCSAFLVLMVAEMAGVKNGIGYYIFQQQNFALYDQVFACLMLIAITFYSLITLLFFIKDKLLVWQRGLIKW